MLRQGLFAFFVLILCFTFVAADTIKGKVTQIDEKGVTIKTKDNKAGKAFTFAKDCKFYKQVKKVKEDLKDGAKAEIFKDLPAKGLNATLTTNDKNEVTEVLVGGKKKKE